MRKNLAINSMMTLKRNEWLTMSKDKDRDEIDDIVAEK